MKRTTRTIMAFLTAMTMTAGALSFNALAQGKLIDASKPGTSIDLAHPENYTNLTERQRQGIEWFNFEQPFNNGINDLETFIWENEQLALNCNITTVETDERGYIFPTHYVLVTYYYTHTEVKEAIEKYLNEKGDDGSWVVFKPVGNYETQPEQITDLFEMQALINEFMRDPANGITDCDVRRNVGVDVSDIKNNRITVYLRSKDDAEKIEKFMAEKNMVIPEGKYLSWSIHEPEEEDVWTEPDFDDSIDVLGDANEDGTTNVRDCACIAKNMANGTGESLPEQADYNLDARKNVRDAAAISGDLASDVPEEIKKPETPRMSWKEKEKTPLVQAYYKMEEAMNDSTEVDAVVYLECWNDDGVDYIEAEYINEQGKKYIENYIKEHGINKDWVRIKEMERVEKCLFVTFNRINFFIRRNDLSCIVYQLVPKRDSDIVKGIKVTYDAQHENDKNAVEEYIKEHGYDKLYPVEYTLVEDPETAVNDPAAPLAE